MHSLFPALIISPLNDEKKAEVAVKKSKHSNFLLGILAFAFKCHLNRHSSGLLSFLHTICMHICARLILLCSLRMERDASFTQKKAERATIRSHFREKYRLPKVCNITDLVPFQKTPLQRQRTTDHLNCSSFHTVSIHFPSTLHPLTFNRLMPHCLFKIQCYI